MRNFFRSPLFRCLVCLILVCCILVNVSPIRAKAFAGLSASALIYLLYAAAAGAVIVPSTIAIANFVGQKVDEKLKVTLAPELLEAWEKVSQRYDNWVPEWDPEDWHNDLRHALAGGLLAAISAMVVELVIEGAIDAVGDSAETGMIYYNNWYLPIFSCDYDTYVYWTMNYSPSSETFYCYASSVLPFSSVLSNGKDVIQFPAGGRYAYYMCSNPYTKWEYVGGSKTGTSFYTETLVWTNYDFMKQDGTLVLAASAPSSTQTITIEPDIYVGDLPDEIRDGEKDENNLNLPIIDPFKIIQSPETAFEDVTKTLQDLKDGVITHDQYLEKVTADDPTVTPDPSDPTDPSEDPEDIPEEIALYTFDLRKIFPFCIPFDLYDFLTCLDATPVAPVINWQIQLPGGSTYPLTVDLSPFDSVAQLLRRLELLVFSIALAIKTRDLIKG